MYVHRNKAESRFLFGQDGSGIHPGRHQSILGVRTYTAWTAPRASNDSYCDSDCDLIHPTRFLVDYVFVSNLTRRTARKIFYQS